MKTKILAALAMLAISAPAMAQTAAVIPVTPVSPLTAPAPALYTKAAALPYNYPTTKCGLYFGVNTMGSTASVATAQVGTQMVMGSIGATAGYTCPMGGTAGYTLR